MFFPECETLANEHSDLKNVIEKIDALLHSISPSGVLRPEIIAKKIKEKPSQVSGIFELLSEEKIQLLHKEKYLECPYCETMIDILDYSNAIENQDIFECTNCQQDLTEIIPNERGIYRLNSGKIKMKEKKEPKSKKEEKYPSLNIELPSQIIENPFKNTPLMHYYSKEPEWEESKPLAGKRVFFVLHFLKDLIPFVKACENLGLDLRNSYFFYKDYPYPQKEAIKEWLENEGATVKHRSNINQYVKQIANSPPEQIGEILIIEDGGFFVPLIHKQYPELIPHVIGAVEQTTRGIRNAETIEKLEFPIISVATCNLKNEFEPTYIAEAVVDNIKKLLPQISMRGKNIALFGCGAIGKEVAKWLRTKGSNVTIIEPSNTNRIWANQNGFSLSDSPRDAVLNKDFVIGASGNESINSNVISNLSHNTHLVSASSELYEIDIDELKRQSTDEKPLKNEDTIIGTSFIYSSEKKIHVLANGYPINFWGFESMPEEASDLIMSLILLSSLELASGNYSEPIINPEAVNEIAEKHDIAGKFLDIQR